MGLPLLGPEASLCPWDPRTILFLTLVLEVHLRWSPGGLEHPFI